MRIPVIAGRSFMPAEKPESHTILVNQSFARRYFAGRDPIGGRVSRQDDPAKWSTVVGVIGDVRHTSLEEPAEPQIYNPDPEFGGGYIAIRSSLPPKTLAANVRAILHSLDPNLATGEIQTMGDLQSEASARRRFQTSLLTIFAGIALFLALVGLYGLMAYSVSLRTREVGIRMALGAQRRDVLLLVVKKAVFLLALGMAFGLLGAWFASQAMRSFLFGVGQHDPITILSVCALLAACGLTASFIPARRAASVDPMKALRVE
jgi:predicted permease